jgi:DNA-binding response OmpR family regulator
MDPLLCFPNPPPPAVLKALCSSGHSWHGIDGPEDVARFEPDNGWAGAVVAAVDEYVEAALALCTALRQGDGPLSPLLLVVEATTLDRLAGSAALFEDFVLASAAPEEIEARISHMFWRTGRSSDVNDAVIAYGPLALNVETYQAAIAGRALDLTYMEYELLRFLASHPGKVFTRETLLSRVWNYEYFGGARTVDVHVRRLRAKLGEEHAHLIETVRSVGYRFGRPSWTGRT